MENTLWLIWLFINTYNALTLRVRWTRRYASVYLGAYVLGVCELFLMAIRDVWVVQEHCIYLSPQYLVNLYCQISIVSHPSQLLTINSNV